jgi:hypothetical protein
MHALLPPGLAVGKGINKFFDFSTGQFDLVAVFTVKYQPRTSL